MKRKLIAVALLGAAAVLVVVVAWAERSGKLVSDEDQRSILSRPLRLNATDDLAFDELRRALAVHKYRANERDVAEYADVFLDTPDDELLAAGYTFRIRRTEPRIDGQDWIVRLRREWAMLDPRGVEPALDLRETLDAATGERVVAGDWSRLLGEDGGQPATRLREVLTELGIARGRVVPRWRANVERTRYDVDDRGRTWFELDHERWSIRAFEGGPAAEVVDLVVDTSLSRDDPELLRRVGTMIQVAQTLGRVRIVDREPLARIVAR